MKAIDLTYKLHSTPAFYMIADNLYQGNINIYGLSTRLKNVEYWINTERELSRNKLGMDYVFVGERDMDKVREYIAEFTKDVLFQKLLEAFHVGLYEIALEYVGQIKKREGIC